MKDYKFEHEDYYIKKHAEVVLANAMNSAWIAAYSAAIIAGKEGRAALEIAHTAASEFREWRGDGEGEAGKDNAGAVVEIDQLVLFLHDDFAAEYDGTESPVECSIRLLTAYKASLDKPAQGSADKCTDCPQVAAAKDAQIQAMTELSNARRDVTSTERDLSKVAIQRDAAFAILRGLSKIQVGYRASLDNALIVGECIEQARALLKRIGAAP